MAKQNIVSYREEAKTFQTKFDDINTFVQNISDTVTLKKPADRIKSAIDKNFAATYNQGLQQATSDYKAGKISGVEYERNVRLHKLLYDVKTRTISAIVDSIFDNLWKRILEQMKDDSALNYLSASYYRDIVNQWYIDNIYSSQLYIGYMGMVQAMYNLTRFKDERSVTPDALKAAEESFRRAYYELTGNQAGIESMRNKNSEQQQAVDRFFNEVNKAYTDKQMLLAIATLMSQGRITEALEMFNKFLTSQEVNHEYSCTNTYWGTYAMLLIAELIPDEHKNKFLQSFSDATGTLAQYMMFLPETLAIPLKILNMFTFEVRSVSSADKERLRRLYSEISSKIIEWTERPCAIFEMVAYIAEFLLLLKTNDMLSFNIKDEEEQIRLMKMFGSTDAMNVLENSLELAIDEIINVGLDKAESFNFFYMFLILTYKSYITSEFVFAMLDAVMEG